MSHLPLLLSEVSLEFRVSKAAEELVFARPVHLRRLLLRSLGMGLHLRLGRRRAQVQANLSEGVHEATPLIIRELDGGWKKMERRTDRGIMVTDFHRPCQ